MKSNLTAKLLIAVLLSVPVGLLHATLPTNSIVDMRFSEGSGTTTANDGFVGGTASFYDALVSGFPAFTNNVPTGTYVPAANAFAMDFGNITGNSATGEGQRAVDLTSSLPGNFPPIDTGNLGTDFPQVTVCGWLNARVLATGSGGNRIAFALLGPAGPGFDLVQRGSGGLSMTINEYFDTSPESSPLKITADLNMGSNNWVFFAVTYDPGLASGQMKYYFGSAKKLAALDVAHTYVPAGGYGTIVTNTGKLTVGNFNELEPARDGRGGSSRVFRGLIDELRIYTNALTLDEIQQAQLNSAVTPVAASFLKQPASQTVAAQQNAFFDADATGSGTVTFQWKTNNVNVPGATNATFSLSPVLLTDNGMTVAVGVTNAVGGVLSTNAVLTVIPNVPHVVSLSFTDGEELATTNVGSLAGYMELKRNANLPVLTNKVPSGPFAPSPLHNTRSIYMDNASANRALDFTNNLIGPEGTLGSMNGLTICGWLNSGNTSFRTTSTTRGNALINACNAANNGFCLMLRTNGGATLNSYLVLMVNENPNTVIAPNRSSFDQIPVDVTGGAANWIFFAVTYDGTLSTANLNFYFGDPNNAATNDVIGAITYNKGVIPNTGRMTVGNHNNAFTAGAGSFGGRSVSGLNGTAYRGYFDEIKVFTKVLTLAEIQQQQVAPAVPTLLVYSPSGPNLNLSWETATHAPYQLKSRTNLSAGGWSNVTASESVSGNIHSVTVPRDKETEFFRIFRQ